MGLPILPGAYTRDRWNVLRDGYEAAAAYVRRVTEQTRGPHVVQVLSDGAVVVRPACKFDQDDMDVLVQRQEFVGLFTRAAEPEAIEDALIFRARELTA